MNNEQQLFDIKGNTALVTGASSGLGKHFSQVLSSYGANVVLAARRVDRLQQTVRTIRLSGGCAECVALDVTSRSSVEASFDFALRMYGCVDIVINNAGVASRGDALEILEEDWDYVVNTNLKGAWLVAQQAGRTMRHNANGGSLINICSILGIRVMGGVAPYAISKSGLEHMTRVLAFEWARYGIRVNAIAPGYIKTDINRAFLESAAGQRAIQKIPQKRYGAPSDLDGTLLLLASDASSYMTGSTIVVDGGHLQSSM